MGANSKIRNLEAYTLRTASKFFPFLTEDPWVREDVGQVAKLVPLLPGADARTAYRELYRLARDLGWRKTNIPGSWNKKKWVKD